MTNKEISYAPEDTLQKMTTRTMAVGFALDSRLGIEPRLEHGEWVYGPFKARTEDFVMPWQLDFLNASVTEILESVEKRGRAYSWYGDEFAAMAKVEKLNEGDTNQNALILHRNTSKTIVGLYFVPNGEFELSVGFRAKANGRQRIYQYTSGLIKTENMTCEEYRFIAQNLQEFSLLLEETPAKQEQKK